MTARSPLASALEEYVDAGRVAAADARARLAVSELEARAIASIGADPGIRPSALRDRLGVTSAGVTTLVDRLVARGLLRREVDVVDRRVNHIYLEIDLDAEPWSLLGRFHVDVERAISAEPVEASRAFAEMLLRVTGRVRARV